MNTKEKTKLLIEREGQTETDRQTDRQTDTDKQRQRQTERQKDGETETDRERQRDRQTDRDRETVNDDNDDYDDDNDDDDDPVDDSVLPFHHTTPTAETAGDLTLLLTSDGAESHCEPYNDTDPGKGAWGVEWGGGGWAEKEEGCKRCMAVVCGFTRACLSHLFTLSLG